MQQPPIWSTSGTILGINPAGFAGNLIDAQINAVQKFAVSSTGAITTASVTASRAVATNSSNVLVASATTDTELGFVSGVTSAIQTQLNSKLAKATGDIDLTSFAAANNQSSPADVTGLAFANANVRAAKIILSVFVNATSSTYEAFEMLAIQRGADWQMSQTSVGDSSGFVFTITTAGQIQYTSTNNAGFVSAAVRFRALVTST